MTRDQAVQRLKKLRLEINRHRYLYHVKDTQEISDGALDALKHELETIESAYPDLITSDSPTQRIGGKALTQFKQVPHKTRMLSLQDAFSWEELIQWEERNQKFIPSIFEYFVELKIDGVAVTLIYQDGTFSQAATRGDGLTGEDVTHNLRTIQDIPLTLSLPAKGRVEIRGEVYMLKKDFTDFNRRRIKNGEKEYANPRNFAAGSIRQLDPKLTARRPLRFYAWEITSGGKVTTRQKEYQLLRKLGFPVPPEAKLYRTLKSLWLYLEKEEKKRLHRPFLVDGAVIKVNNLELSQRLGIVGKAPRGSIAYKFSAEEATTIVEDIAIQVGRTGALTPVAHLRPIQIAGTTVSRATLHNADEIKRKDIRIGDTVVIHKAGDIIPEIVKVLPRLRPRGAKPFKMPAKCPVCRQAVVKEKEGVLYRCANERCFPMIRERIRHAVGRSGFDIAGLGENIIEQLLQAGLIKDPADLWQLKTGDLLTLPHFAEKKATNLFYEIQAIKKITLARFIIALGVPNVGAVTAQDLAGEFHAIEKLKMASKQKLLAIDGIGDKVADGIIDFFRSKDTLALLNKYTKNGLVVMRTKSSGRLHGKTFLFTGSIPGMTREEAKHRVQTAGGKIASEVGKNVSFIVIGDKPGNKVKRAQELNIQTLTVKSFMKMIVT